MEQTKLDSGCGFNLLEDPWILASEKDGTVKAFSIKEFFAHAHELSSFSGEIPTQDAAILRLLLGILYAMYTRVDETGAPLQPKLSALRLWSALWTKQRFSEDVIGRYLSQYRERFWLFHPTQPFWQVAFDSEPVNEQGITLKPTIIDAPKMIGDLADGNKPNLFCNREEKQGVSFPEAARWLVYCNAFDVSPAGNPGKNPRTVKGFGHPFPADVGLTWVEGSNLFETLMLNLVLRNGNQDWPDAPAWWEAPPPCTTAADLERTEIPAPTSIVELMSMQYRYIRLVRQDHLVTGYELWSGVKFMGGNAFIEPMTAWLVSKKDGKHYPQKHKPAKQMWRDFAVFAPISGNDNNPGVIKWLDWLRSKNITLPTVRLRIAGITYIKDTAVGDVFSDSLQVNAKVLCAIEESDREKMWNIRITREIETTEKLVYYLGNFASDLALAAGDGKDGAGRRSAAEEEAYFRLDAPFRLWLAAIVPGESELDDACQAWRETACRIVRRLGRELVGEAGDAALIGRMVEKAKKKELLTAPMAYNRFAVRVRKTQQEG